MLFAFWHLHTRMLCFLFWKDSFVSCQIRGIQAELDQGEEESEKRIRKLETALKWVQVLLYERV